MLGPISEALSQQASVFPEVFKHPVLKKSPPLEFVEVTDSLRGIQSFSGQFVQEKQISGLSRSLRSSGSFDFVATQGLCWRIRTPFYSDLLVSEEEMVQRDQDGVKEKLFTENAAVIRGFTRIFLSAFAGETERLARRFDTYFEGTADKWSLGFRPKELQTSKFISYIMLHGAKTTEGITIVDGGGDTTLITFSEVEVSRQLPDAETKSCFSE
jgi:hypothetical protein